MNTQKIRESIGKREQIYRAYIGKLNKIYDVISLHSKHLDEDFQRVFINKPVEDGEVKNYRIDGKENFLLQWTGLIDVNKKKSYEGDVVKNVHGKIGVIMKKDCDFIFKHGDGELDYYPLVNFVIDGNFLLEIIGNIFENENLLQTT